MTYLLIITLAPSPIPSQIPHTLFDIISLDVDAVLCNDQDTRKTVHTCARSKMPQHNIVNNVYLVILKERKHKFDKWIIPLVSNQQSLALQLLLHYL